MTGIQLGGLASGMDTDAIISQLMAIDAAPRTRLVLQQSAAQVRQQALKDVESRLKTLQYAVEDLGSPTLWSPTQTVTSSDDKVMSATLNGGAAPGGYTIAVTQLATSAQQTFAWTSQASASTLSINGQNVDLAAGATIDDAVSTINSNEALGVYAVNVGGNQLVLTSRDTGSATTISASGAAIALQSTRAGQDAQYTVNGGALQTSATNAVSNLVPGVDVTLKAVTAGATVDVSTPGIDHQAVVDKVKAFIAAYNDAVTFINGKLGEKRVANPANAADADQGVLFGDSGLSDIVSSLRTSVGSPVAGMSSPYDLLANIGISTGATTGSGTTSQDAIDGKLTLDEDKLNAALDGDPLSVQKLLGGQLGTPGFSQAFDGVLTPLVEVNGMLDQRVDMAGNELNDIGDAISDLNDRLAAREESLRKQFTAMEMALAQSQQQGADLASRLASLGG